MGVFAAVGNSVPKTVAFYSRKEKGLVVLQVELCPVSADGVIAPEALPNKFVVSSRGRVSRLDMFQT